MLTGLELPEPSHQVSKAVFERDVGAQPPPAEGYEEPDPNYSAPSPNYDQPDPNYNVPTPSPGYSGANIATKPPVRDGDSCQASFYNWS